MKLLSYNLFVATDFCFILEAQLHNFVAFLLSLLTPPNFTEYVAV